MCSSAISRTVLTWSSHREYTAFFPSFRYVTRLASLSILSWWDVADMDIDRASLMSHTHISPESRARRIRTRVGSEKILKKSERPSTSPDAGMLSFARATVSPWTSRMSQVSSLRTLPS